MAAGTGGFLFLVREMVATVKPGEPGLIRLSPV
jgi:hypothetical protein